MTHHAKQLRGAECWAAAVASVCWGWVGVAVCVRAAQGLEISQVDKFKSNYRVLELKKISDRTVQSFTREEVRRRGQGVDFRLEIMGVII